jgi:GAF domain-containing protein
MIYAPMHPNEDERLKILYTKNLLDSERDPRFDALTKEASVKFNVPISTVSILDKDREWFKSCQGLDVTEGDRKLSFCGHALLKQDVFISEDTLKDEIFKDNPYVVGKPYIRFYAGIALMDRKTKLPMGVFCIKDIKPRTMEVDDLAEFMILAGKVEDLINQD